MANQKLTFTCPRRNTVTLIIAVSIKLSWRKMEWLPAGILFVVHLRGAIWTRWAGELFPGARREGHIDQMGESHPKSRTRGCQGGHLGSSCLLYLSPVGLGVRCGLVTDMSPLSFLSIDLITLLLLSHCLLGEFHHVLFYLLGQQT